MKNHKLQSVKKLFRPSTMTVAMALLLFFGAAISPISAEKVSRVVSDDGSSSEIVRSGEPTSCQQDMRLFAHNRLNQYRDDINTHFQNKSSTSSLLDDAVNIYDEFRRDINNEFNSYFPDAGNTQTAESTEIQDCLTVLNNNLEQARSFLRIKATGTSKVKQTTALLDKYKAINQQLSVLNKSVLKFKSYMETFANKLPCYIEKNCNAG